MSEERVYERVGAVRPSQLLHTYGPGSIIDLPQMSAMIGGIDGWRTERTEVLVEDRLLAAVKAALGNQVRELRRPPWMEEERDVFAEWARTGIPVQVFPRWVRCTACSQLSRIDSGLFALRTNAYRPDWARYVHANCPKAHAPLAVAARYVLACENGHMDDFPWIEYVHGPDPPCDGPMLRLFDSFRGRSTGETIVTCTGCNRTRPLNLAFGERARWVLPECRGRHPHLGDYDEGCGARVRALLLGASNSWFGVTMAVLSIPRTSEELPQLVDRLWGALSKARSPEVLDYMIEEKPELSFLRSRDRAALWAVIEARRSGEEQIQASHTDLLAPEWQVLSDPDHAPAGDDFRVVRSAAPPRYADQVAEVVLAERLREVVAITGLTRIEAPTPGPDGAIRNRAPLSRTPPVWVPATEVRGEGIFLRFGEGAVATWEDRVAGGPRDEALRHAHLRWYERRGVEVPPDWPGPRYPLLHTLAHLLIREIALECGYAAASIRERIYARHADPAMAGILLYTAAPDSEGTLGGLVTLGRPETVERVLRQALDHARLCSSDPLCAEHVPGPDDLSLHAAACHACAFAAETSCERGNRYLDRNLVVETLAGIGTEFFAG